MDKTTLERIVKAVVSWNGLKVEFDPKFLQYQDHFELNEELKDGVLIITTKMKGDK